MSVLPSVFHLSFLAPLSKLNLSLCFAGVNERNYHIFYEVTSSRSRGHLAVLASCLSDVCACLVEGIVR